MTRDERSQQIWFFVFVVAFFAGLGLLLAGLAPARLAASKPPDPWVEKIVVTADTASKSLLVLPAGEGCSPGAVNADPISVAAEDQPVLKNLAACDRVFVYTEKDKTTSHVRVKTIAVGVLGALGALLLAFSIVFGGTLMLTASHPWSFALGLDGRLSNSQTQIYLWFLAFATIYVAEFGLRLGLTGFFGGIGAPAKLLALAGISAATFGGARASTTYKAQSDPAAAAAAKKPPETERTRLQVLWDLFTNDAGKVDLGDFQMIVLTGVAIVIYLGTALVYLTSLPVLSHVDLPAIDDTLLGGTAAAQGAYLFKKVGSSLGN